MLIKIFDSNYIEIVSLMNYVGYIELIDKGDFYVYCESDC